MNPVELERRLQRIERALEDLASAGRPRIRVGTWVPEMFGGTTYGTTTYLSGYHTGDFIVINQVCWIMMQVYWTTTTATGDMQFTLPIQTATERRPVFTTRHQFFTYSSDATIIATAEPATTYVKLLARAPNWSAYMPVSGYGYVSISGFYWI